MTWLTHKWSWICSVCHNHNPVLSSFMICHRVCNKSNMTVHNVEQELLTLPEHLSAHLMWPSVYISNDLLKENLSYWAETKSGTYRWTWVKLNAPPPMLGGGGIKSSMSHFSVTTVTGEINSITLPKKTISAKGFSRANEKLALIVVNEKKINQCLINLFIDFCTQQNNRHGNRPKHTH